MLSRDGRRVQLSEELKDLTTRGAGLTEDRVAVILGQWYHPLHYFPVFLSRLISVAPTIEAQTFISRILWQELGQGNPKLAHEEIYIDTMTDAGFERGVIAASPAFESTRHLVNRYEEASANYLSGLGFLYGTEVADLAMVSSIGKLVRNCTGKGALPWVDIHVEQEPDHVETSCKTLMPAFLREEQAQIISSAEEMWSLWVNFFAGVKQSVLQ
jgi:hypothetical protein